ncbi:hypothetical protein NPIL_282191 [Nephila pilipes]|uniref:Uncharacterized protein n=1 Tax=Nephila pilipes TaxID=299642 RepID=A0A8X6QJA8_NEPPI|nr:hypothetical protein NPIL_282191 [Nephila pilipes]
MCERSSKEKTCQEIIFQKVAFTEYAEFVFNGSPLCLESSNVKWWLLAKGEISSFCRLLMEHTICPEIFSIQVKANSFIKFLPLLMIRMSESRSLSLFKIYKIHRQHNGTDHAETSKA